MAYINGYIMSDYELSQDVVALFKELALQDQNWKREDDGGYLFCFSTKECRLDDTIKVIHKLASVKSKDVDTWEYIDANITIRFESDQDRIDVYELQGGDVRHLSVSFKPKDVC